MSRRVPARIWQMVDCETPSPGGTMLAGHPRGDLTPYALGARRIFGVSSVLAAGDRQHSSGQRLEVGSCRASEPHARRHQDLLSGEVEQGSILAMVRLVSRDSGGEVFEVVREATGARPTVPTRGRPRARANEWTEQGTDDDSPLAVREMGARGLIMAGARRAGMRRRSCFATFATIPPDRRAARRTKASC